MKRKPFFALSFLLLILTLPSCEQKNLYDESKQPQKEQTVADLIVPDGFDWKMTKNAQCAITAQSACDVSVYSNKGCTEDTKLATIQTYDGTITIPLSMPANSKEAYLQYETVNGKKIVLTATADNDNAIHFTVPQDSKPISRTRAVATTRGADMGYGTISYPNSGWGTILFEDMFPSLGDYDFNDFVLAYRVQIPFYSSGYRSIIDEGIQLGIQLKAIGGSLSYAPCLRLMNLQAKDIDDIEVYQNFNTSVSEVDWSAGPNDEVILNFNNLVAATSRPSGGSFFNTEKDYVTNKLPELNIVIYLNDEVDVQSVSFESFDFYLTKGNQNTEIHLGGYEPVYYTYPKGDSSLGNDYYYNNHRLIWGMSVPAPIAHVIEKGNFLDAYKDFAGWATSGGKNNVDWYNGKKNNDLLIKND